MSNQTDLISLSQGDGSALTGVGKVLQVVSATKTDTFSQGQSPNSISGTNVPGLTPAITPSSTSSKILVTVHLNVGHSSPTQVSDQDKGFVLHRNGSPIAIGDAAGSRSRITTMQNHTNQSGFSHMAMTFLDEPNTTSSVTYSVRCFQGAGSTQTIYVNMDYSNGDASYTARGVSTLTLMEIAG
jgi:hypothetical protein